MTGELNDKVRVSHMSGILLVYKERNTKYIYFMTGGVDLSYYYYS